MCGRFTISISNKELKDYLNEHFSIEDFENEFEIPRFNVAPGQNIIAVINDGTKNKVGYLKWGFVPFFAKDEKIGYNMINAKAETLSEKASFRESFKNKRCVIIADSFYEWLKKDDEKIPMRILMKNKSPFPIAGIWSIYHRLDGTKLYTCSIITTKANELVNNIHDRMPVILTDDSLNTWLNTKITDSNVLSKLLIPYNSQAMLAYKVSKTVNNPANEKAECINSL